MPSVSAPWTTRPPPIQRISANVKEPTKLISGMKTEKSATDLRLALQVIVVEAVEILAATGARG